MKFFTQSFLVIGVLFIATPAFAAPIVPGSFSTTWDTGVTNSIVIDLGVCPSAVYWEEISNVANNGTSTVCVGSDQTITFPSPGQYRVDFSGAFTTIDIGSAANRNKFRSVEQWGGSQWVNMIATFASVDSLVFNAIDVPDLSNVTSLESFFSGADNFNSPIGNWDVSNITSMQGTFSFTDIFNQDISAWDVSSVTNFRELFREAKAFNQPLDSWDVSSATQMHWMFWNAEVFNQPLNNWDVSSVAQFGGYSGPYDNFGMFAGAIAFNQPLNNWDVSGATIMSGMFNGAVSFNQDISMWDVSSVFYLRNMFTGATAFNQPLNSWNVSSATNMFGMFENATAFNQPLNSWNVSNVTSMNYMLSGTALSAVNYTSLLNSWALLSLQSGVNLNADTEYCSTAQTARDTLTTTYSWVISDNGSTPCYTLTYTAGPNATLIGNGTQTIVDGADGTSVEIVPDAGYVFTGWSDGPTDNPRTDMSVSADSTVTAVLVATGRGGSTGTRVGERFKNQLSTTTSTAAVVTKESFLASLQTFIDYLKLNDEEIDNLPPAESKKLIIAMRDIVVYLLTLLKI